MTLPDTLAALSAKATQGTWGIWFEQINGKADAAIQELIDQVHHTDPIGQSLVMLDADGKCPAITGCGPTSAANAAFIVALVNAYRTGQLVPVPSVERVSKAVHEALCRVDVIRYLDLPPQTAENVAMVVVAAMQEGRE